MPTVLDLIHGRVRHPWKVVPDPWRSVSMGALHYTHASLVEMINTISTPVLVGLYLG